jgi:hypothetical protein
MTMKNTVFWNAAPCRSCVNRRFGGTYLLHIRSRRNPLLTLIHRSWISSTPNMEAIRSSETSVNKIPTRRHIPEDGILHIITCIPVKTNRRFGRNHLQGRSVCKQSSEERTAPSRFCENFKFHFKSLRALRRLAWR